MNPKASIRDSLTRLILAGLVCNDAGATSLIPRTPATFAVATEGTGYTAGPAVLEFPDGNSVSVTLLVDDGQITDIQYVSGFVGASGTADVVQDGGSAGTATVATWVSFADDLAVIDFGELIQQDEWRYTLSGKTVTEHATAPGSSKTVTVNMLWTDEAVDLASAATLLAGRKVAGSAKTLTNAIDTTQHWGFASEFRPAARFCVLSVDWTALDSGSSFTLSLRINRV